MAYQYVWGPSVRPHPIRCSKIYPGNSTCGLPEDGIVICWGGGSLVADILRNDRFTAISKNADLACGLREDGSVLCWGWRASEPSRMEQLTAISRGIFHTCGVQDGSVVCWTKLEDYEDGNFGQDSPPENERFKSVSSGSYHTCGLSEDGVIGCWGYNVYGQSSPPLR